MQKPTIRSTIRDPERDITFHVMAYRELTRDELVLAVRQLYRQKKLKRPKPGSTVTIVTIIGHDGP